MQALTKRADEEGSDEGYFRFVRRAAENPIARKVKRADLEDNTDANRVKALAEQSQALAAELRSGAEEYRRQAEAADAALAVELCKVADQFDERADGLEDKPKRLEAKYAEAIRILDEMDQKGVTAAEGAKQ